MKGRFQPAGLRAALWGMLLLTPLSGCVHRRLVVRTNPPGALVYVDNKEIGTTPVSVPFIYYGTREIKVVKSGYETVKDRVRVNPPWYEYPGAEFVSENLVPWELNDDRYLMYEMQPKLVTPTQDLLNRGNELRSANHTPANLPAAPPAMQNGPALPYELPQQ